MTDRMPSDGTAMIVCHCNLIRRDEIVDAVEDLLRRGPARPVTPRCVYRALKNCGKCCGCFPAVETLIADVLRDFGADDLKTAPVAA